MTSAKNWIADIWKSLLTASLWLTGFGLMLASSGIDGAYLARIMHPFWLGYVLNTTSDIASLALSYWYGNLARRGVKRAKIVLVLDSILVAYSWFISFLELRITLLVVETAEATPRIAFFLAGFIPIAIAAVGYTNSLLATKGKAAVTEKQVALIPATFEIFTEIYQNLDGKRKGLTAKGVATLLEKAGYEPKSARTCGNWLVKARNLQ